ncbi:D-alanine--D-alanine ligase family protein [Paraliomyxa miuraensis]|uniref:D-alanine--D-alanine ligase family protein n=1 Tax=Paraliomyxa miuraensis TaxID=376150 RepID=UPI00225140F7|nr:D-alanine--D-alanine ligase family protein [Paraliomyxa miuraensis]MCX4240810.1 D-alanine--D-alanine ligase [Paraliomyxa miuraensis]
MSPTRLLVAFGGASSEHEISLRSASSVLCAVDRQRWQPVPLAIARDGTWRTGSSSDQPDPTELAGLVANGEVVADLRALKAELAFPVLHGPYGEDGTIQGLFEILGLPYVGSGVLASALCMDKSAQKHLLASAAPDVPLVPWREFLASDLATDAGIERAVQEIRDTLGFPCFVKPVNMGSSVGVSRARGVDELPAALRGAARYDHRVIVEQGIDAREIEIAVLGNGGDETRLSSPGEIGLPPGVWYDYETKYVNDVSTLHIPASLPDDAVETIRRTALRAFQVTGCKGLARIDFLLCRKTGTAYLNELNTMPGFTSISMYPKMMGHAGVSYPELITALCELALQHHQARRQLSNLRE